MTSSVGFLEENFISTLWSAPLLLLGRWQSSWSSSFFVTIILLTILIFVTIIILAFVIFTIVILATIIILAFVILVTIVIVVTIIILSTIIRAFRWMQRDTWCANQRTNFLEKTSSRKSPWPLCSCQVTFFLQNFTHPGVCVKYKFCNSIRIIYWKPSRPDTYYNINFSYIYSYLKPTLLICQKMPFKYFSVICITEFFRNLSLLSCMYYILFNTFGQSLFAIYKYSNNAKPNEGKDHSFLYNKD